MSTKTCKVTFPNGLGSPKAAAADVAALQKALGFSDAFATYLTTQNGFSFKALDRATPGLLDESVVDEDTHGPDLVTLYDLAEIEEQNAAKQPFAGLAAFFGRGYGGDEYAEVLVGAHHGRIVNLSHEFCGGAKTLRDLGEACEDFGDFSDGEDFYELEPAAQADILFGTQDLDLAWAVAPSIDAFLARAVFCKPNGTGIVVPQT